MRTLRASSVYPLVLAIAITATIGARPAVADPAVSGYPLVMAATGDSITQAAGADGVSAADQPARSWSTGTDVQSHFARIGVAAPTAQTFNDARSGAAMRSLASQMATVNTRGATYVTVLMGGNDACTPTEGSMTPVAEFAGQFQSAMDTLVAGSPTARVFVASVPDPYRLWEIFHADPNAVAVWTTYGICQSMLANPQSLDQADVDRRARVRQRVIDYNAELQRVCALYLRCRFDGNAVFNTPFDPADVTADYFHPSTQGQNRLASVTWPRTFDFSEGTPPVTTASATPDATGYTVTLSATDNVGVAGIETRLGAAAWVRYTGSLSVAFGHTLTYRGIDVNGNSEATATFAPVVQPVTLSAPASGPAGVVSLTWTASATAATHAVTYDVMRRPAGTAGFAAVASVSGLAYDDTPAADGTYEYTVRAVVGAATSVDSNVVSGLSDRTPPSASQLSAATGVTTGTVDLSWTAATDGGTGVSGYTVRWVQTNTCPAASAAAYPNALVLGNVTSVTIGGLASRRHCFYVSATDVAGNVGSTSNIAQARAR